MAAAVLLALPLASIGRLDWILRHDTRDDASRWIAANAGEGDRIAVLGWRKTLPRFDREPVLVSNLESVSGDPSLAYLVVTAEDGEPYRRVLSGPGVVAGMTQAAAFTASSWGLFDFIEGMSPGVVVFRRTPR